MTDPTALYQSIILDHNRRPRNYGALEGADRVQEGRNPLCGDELTLWVKLGEAGGTIEDVRFVAKGCAISRASASLLTAAVKGKRVEEAEALFARVHRVLTGRGEEGETLPGSLAALGGVSRFPMRVKCASLAWHALHAALAAPDESPAPVTTDDAP